jgi:RNA polymerase subunit RPABC4/transcription elongation factor Spt4
MVYKLRVVVEKVDPKTNKVIEKMSVDSFDIRRPEKIIDVGLRHIQQIDLLKRIQQKYIDEQYAIISDEPKRCPKCKVALNRNGYKQSDFHAVFSDHRVKIQKHTCPVCHENQVPSIKSLFGTSIHPE